MDDPAAVYLRSAIDTVGRYQVPDGLNEAHASTTGFAARYGYGIVGRYQDVSDLPLPGPDSAFVRMLDDLSAGVVRVVLVPSKTWLSTLPEAQQRMAAMIAAHGGTLITVDAVSALGIDPVVGTAEADPTGFAREI